MQTHNLQDQELLKLGYLALVEKLGPAGFVRFVSLHEPPAGDYVKADKPIDHMTVQEILDEALRLEAERGNDRNAGR
jgi:hypothetical protein